MDSRLWEAQLGPFGRSHAVVRLDFPAHRLTCEIPAARRVTMPDAAHLPNLERPDDFNRIVLEFLAEHGV